MKISISATNPCHLYPLALELAAVDALGCYYSGYPAWKLQPPPELPVRTHSWRTTAVYGALRLPARLRPPTRAMFLWQDHGFDHWVGAHVAPADFIHAMPGQCRDTFHGARKLGIHTVMNHATGPVRDWVRIMEPEYARVGLKLEEVCPYDADYFAREAEEYALASYHCAASSVVKAALVGHGIPEERIWQVPYGADPAVFCPPAMPPPPEPFRIVFAGQVGLRKGLRALLEALALAGRPRWEMHFYGARLGEAEHDLAAYRGVVPLQFHGAVSQQALAEAFRIGSVLVLPSLEEGFGLVVPQALACGLPAIVSEATGAKDLLRPRENGSIVPVNDADALAAELTWWAEHPQRVQESHAWGPTAQELLRLSELALTC